MLQIHRGKNIQLAKIKKMQEIHDFLARFKEDLWIDNFLLSIKFKVVKE